MTNHWTNGEGMQGYATRDESEARRMFRKRFNREAKDVVKIEDQISCHYFLGPVEDSKHGNR